MTDQPGTEATSRFSLRARLTLWMVIICLAIQLASGLIVLTYLKSSVAGLADDRIRDEVIGLTGRLVALVILAGIVAAGLAGWFIAGLATAPLHRLRQIAGSLVPDSAVPPSVLPHETSKEAAALEKDLQDTRAKLRQAFAAQDRFISNVSHELKTPIAVLLVEAQTLSPKGLPAPAGRFVKSVTEEMQRLGRMIDSFLTLTKLRGGMTLATSKPCDVNDFVMEAVSECVRMASQYGVSLDPHLEDTPKPLVVTGDAELLRVMVDNLVRNAIRFSPGGMSVSVSVKGQNDDCLVSVRDQGPGVPEEMMDRLFDRFAQAPTEINRGHGHGLGLSISQGIAELHGGRIVVRNIPDGGCEFMAKLPLAPAKDPAAGSD